MDCILALDGACHPLHISCVL